MPSQDFIELMTKLHKEKYNMLSKRMEYHGLDESPSLRATVTLEKEGKQISIQSSEWDFIKYVTELRGVADITGEHRFTRLRDPNQYNADVEHLIDIDKSKLKSAADDLRSKKFEFTYNPLKMIDEFLKSERSVKNKKFLPLKTDYHHILMAALLQSKAMLETRERIIKKYPETQKLVKAVEGIFLKSFRPTRNALKDYKFYKKYLNFDIDYLGERMSAQLIVADDTVKDFIRRSKIHSDIAIPKMMNIYGRFLEILGPMINLIRIGLELKRGNSSPEAVYKVGENIEILKSDPDYGSFFPMLH
jgi:hypothetical protein